MHYDDIKSNIEPLAIIGMSCRFPSTTDTLDKYWKLLVEGETTTGKIPESRWNSYKSLSPKVAASLNSATSFGSFLSDIEGFDADFFGISAREAEYIDPQQRIILELSWEALENAGVVPSSLRGSDVGVYMAANSFDFGHRLMADLAEIQPWTVNGGMLFGIANRVSYAFDLRGPSMVVDTACAGSLTALHLASEALRCREIPLAIVGGVNIMSNPGMTIALDAAGATAPDGKSKAFDKSSNGYGRGEGAGIVILKRFSAALEAGDRILALVRGSGIFQDGRTAGMMAPNSKAQETMLHKIYERFNILPSSVDYVEAHGTGTPAGDKAEVDALSYVFGKDRKIESSCWIGSAKPNIGHLEAGAGMAGLIKVVLSMKHGVLPPSVHNELTSDIDWETSGLRVVKKPTIWPHSKHPKRAGVSCFGVGGTISHAIIEETPAVSVSQNKKHKKLTPSVKIFPLSARSNKTLKDNANRLADWIEAHPNIDLNLIGSTLSHHRDHLSKRAVIIATTQEELISGLRKLSLDEENASTITGQSNAGAEKGTVWVFSGHGAQWSGMAVELLEKETVFAKIVDEVGSVFKEELGYTARDAILESDWSSIERIQALTFVIQVGLAAVWHKNGLFPAAIIGHSVGEVAAAVVAGALDIKSAARFACRRATIYQRLAGHGGMALVRLPFDETQQKLRNSLQVVASIAVSPEATIISGDLEALKEIISLWKRERIPVKKITTIDAAFHGPQLDALIPDIRVAAAHLKTYKPSVKLYNTTLSDSRSFTDREAEFWVENSRGMVRLLHAVEAALEDGFTSFLEVSSAPIVASSISEIADFKQYDDVTVCSTLIPNQPEIISMTKSLATLFCSGINVRWSSLYASREFVELPTMAWQHRSFWPTTNVNSSKRFLGHAPETHTLLGQAEHIRSTPPVTVWKTHLNFESRPYPGKHPLFGVEIVPAAALLYSLMKAGSRDDKLPDLTDVTLQTPIPVDNSLDLQIVRQGNAIRISTKQADEQLNEEDSWAWTTHTSALLGINDKQHISKIHNLEELQHRCTEVWSWERIESLYRKRGIGDYGFFWKLCDLHRGDGEIIASFTSQETSLKSTFTWAEVFDAALTICPLLLPDDEVLRMPSHIARVTIHAPLSKEYIIHASRNVNKTSPEECFLEVRILDTMGQEIATIDGIKFGVLDSKISLRNHPADVVFTDVWRTKDFSTTLESLPRSIVFVGKKLDWLQPLANELSTTGISCDFMEKLSLPKVINDTTVIVVGSTLFPNERLEEISEQNAWRLIETAQTVIANSKSMKNIRLSCLTQGVRECKNEESLAQSPLWGVARIIAGERPDLWGGIFDIDVKIPVENLASKFLMALSSSNTNEDVMSISEKDIEVLRLAPISNPTSKSSTEAILKSPLESNLCRADATYLVTGGFGTLGLEAAKYLISKGARRLILAGRQGLPARQTWNVQQDSIIQNTIERIKEMEAAGATILPLAVDISNADSVKEKINPDALGVPPIKGIIHAAGVFQGGVLGQIDKHTLKTVFKPKVRGVINLHRQFPPGSLDFFVQFSSSGQFARLTGQASYAAANSFLDGIARYRNTTGTLDSLSLGWMAWRGMGMSKSIDATMIEARAHGMDEIDTATALNAWRYCDQASLNYAAIFSPTKQSHSVLPILSEIFCETGDNTLPDNASLSIPIENKQEWLIGDVRKLVAMELKLQEEDVEIKRPLIDMGVDSLMTVSLRVRLRQRYGFEFPPTLLWNNPSVYAIANFIDHYQNENENIYVKTNKKAS